MIKNRFLLFYDIIRPLIHLLSFSLFLSEIRHLFHFPQKKKDRSPFTHDYRIVQISFVINAKIQATRHCQKAMPIAHLFPSSRFIAAIAATQGV